MAVNETLRQHYLREMGITPWYPRYIIDGAAPPHERAVADDSAAAQETTAPQKPVAPSAPPAPPPAASAAPKPAEHSSTSRVSPFAFTWISLDERLSVLFQQPAEQRGRLPVPLRDMLMDILKALDPAFARVRPDQVFQFRWPFDAISAAAGTEEAAQAVDGFIQQRLRQVPSHHLLLLVDEEPEWLPGSPGTGSLVPDCISLPSLASMTANPALKKPAWLTMQQLIRVLREPAGNRAD